MKENIIGTLLNAQIDTFVREFSNTSKNVFYDENDKKLIHPGEFGMLRESCIRSFLSQFLPDIYAVSQGYIIGQDNTVSHQCDIIIYHKDYTPNFHAAEYQRFFPIESVIAVGEVKSKVTSKVLDDAFEKLANVKMMKEKITSPSIAISRDLKHKNFDPIHKLRDQLITFLLCDEIECTNVQLVKNITKSWHGSVPRNRVNLLTAIKDGTCVYKYLNGKAWMYPIDKDGTELSLQMHSPIDNYGHIALFVRYLVMLIEEATVLYPELTDHLGSIMKCKIVDLD